MKIYGSMHPNVVKEAIWISKLKFVTTLTLNAELNPQLLKKEKYHSTLKYLNKNAYKCYVFMGKIASKKRVQNVRNLHLRTTYVQLPLVYVSYNFTLWY